MLSRSTHPFPYRLPTRSPDHSFTKTCPYHLIIQIPISCTTPSPPSLCSAPLHFLSFSTTPQPPFVTILQYPITPTIHNNWPHHCLLNISLQINRCPSIQHATDFSPLYFLPKTSFSHPPLSHIVDREYLKQSTGFNSLPIRPLIHALCLNFLLHINTSVIWCPNVIRLVSAPFLAIGAPRRLSNMRTVVLIDLLPWYAKFWISRVASKRSEHSDVPWRSPISMSNSLDSPIVLKDVLASLHVSITNLTNLSDTYPLPMHLYIYLATLVRCLLKVHESPECCFISINLLLYQLSYNEYCSHNARSRHTSVFYSLPPSPPTLNHAPAELQFVLFRMSSFFADAWRCVALSLSHSCSRALYFYDNLLVLYSFFILSNIFHMYQYLDVVCPSFPNLF